MRKVLMILSILLALIGNSYAKEFHCRIIEARDYDKKNIINSLPTPKNEEFIVETDTETNIFFAGEIKYGVSGYKGSRIAGTNNHTQPFITISKLDNKFFDMYLHYAHGGFSFLVSGICKEI
jgi:hypothetical protein